jgi:hypothetical protein
MSSSDGVGCGSPFYLLFQLLAGKYELARQVLGDNVKPLHRALEIGLRLGSKSVLHFMALVGPSSLEPLQYFREYLHETGRLSMESDITSSPSINELVEEWLIENEEFDWDTFPRPLAEVLRDNMLEFAIRRLRTGNGIKVVVNGDGDKESIDARLVKELHPSFFSWMSASKDFSYRDEGMFIPRDFISDL